MPQMVRKRGADEAWLVASVRRVIGWHPPALRSVEGRTAQHTTEVP